MNDFATELNEFAAEIPLAFARNLLERKLVDAGVKPTMHRINKIMNILQYSKNDRVELKIRGLKDIVIEITESDLEEFQKETSSFLENDLSGIMKDMMLDRGRKTFAAVKKNWPSLYQVEREERSRFKRDLEVTWRDGLTNLRMLLSACRSMGAEKHSIYVGDESEIRPGKRFLLIWLQARSCQIADEIITLMEAGFADGAMARWRTLHEVSVIATLIADHDDELAERYLAHEAVEAWEGISLYARTASDLGHRPISARELKRARKRYDACLERYEPSFSKPYGWAAKHLRSSNSFADLTQAAGRSKLQSYYKMASHHVHAGVSGITSKLSTMGNRMIIAGASNAGLLEPGQNTAIALSVATVFLFQDNPSADDVVKLSVVERIRDSAIKGFVRESRKISREERAAR